jgi:signal transduction histidine kinase
MDNAKDMFGYDSLAFFGKVNASISHELKNVMAIISETSGLLEDLSDLASTGTPIAPDMLKSCTASIIEEIQRGFLTIRQMNRFSHSVDTPVEYVNLMDVLDTAINLAGYLSFSGKTHLKPYEGATPMVSTCPFLLMAVVYQTLVYTFKHAEPGTHIDISIQPQGDSAWRIYFPGFNVKISQVFPDLITKNMAKSIGVAICFNHLVDSVELDVPLTIECFTAKNASPEIANMGNPPETRT